MREHGRRADCRAATIAPVELLAHRLCGRRTLQRDQSPASVIRQRRCLEMSAKPNTTRRFELAVIGRKHRFLA